MNEALQWANHELWMTVAFCSGLFLGWALMWRPPDGK